MARPPISGRKSSNASSTFSRSSGKKSSINSGIIVEDSPKSQNTSSMSTSAEKTLQNDKEKSLNTPNTVASQINGQSSSNSLSNINTDLQSDISNECKIVTITKTSAGLGFSISVIGQGSDSMVVIKSVIPDGAASQSGHIESGDDLLEVNGRELKGLPYNEVTNILRLIPPGIVVLKIKHTINEAI